MRQNITKLSAAVLMVSAITGAAHAGGFSRGTADTDIIYEDSTFAVRGGVLYVNPQKTFATVGGAAAHDSAYSDSYVVPSFAMKYRLSENFSCAATYTQPFGAASTYGVDAQTAEGINGAKSAGFDSNEFGATCALNYDVGKGQAYLLGGIYVEDFDYTEVTKLGKLNLKDQSTIGYRMGAAYTIPEYALRAQLMYRSQIDIDATGAFTRPGLNLPSTGVGSLPQSIELNVQSGVAPGWLVYGSVKWTDWSVLQTLDYNISGATPFSGDKHKYYNWKDGWTIQAGVGHAFSDDVSGTINLTWDKGVGTGADIMTDVWTLGTGGQFKVGPGTLKVGGAVSYITAGSKWTAQKATYNATSDGNWSYAVGASYLVKF